MIWERQAVGDYFHASTDRQAIRDRVFALIGKYDFKIHAKIMEKSKAQPQVRETRERFYQYGWYYLFQNIAPKLIGKDTELMITAASIGTKKGQAVFTNSVNDVLQQTVPIPRDKWVTAFCPAAADPCLQVADYCTWAIQRKWESGEQDLRSYNIIKDKIAYEYDLWAHGAHHYY